MIFGVGLPNYGKRKTFADIKRVALAAENLGYDSVWTTDHVIVPQADLEPYGNIMEALTVLALVAPITSRVKLGTSVLVLPQRNAVLAAKQIATIDAASHGRMIVGLGVGWNETEFRNLDMNFKNRGKRLDEAMQLFRTLWSHEDATFHGKYTNIEHGVLGPRPAQKEIPLWIGGNGEPAWRRAATLGDGWHATGALPEDYARGVQRIREMQPTRPQTFSARLSIDLNPHTSSYYEYRGAQRRRVAGTDAQVRETLREYAQAGVEYATLIFPMSDITTTLAQMERFVNEIAPEFK